MQTEIHNFEPFVPADEAWQQLKPMLDKEEKKRRGFIWWWFASFVFIVAIGTGIYMYNSKQPSIATNTIHVQKVNATTSNAYKKTIIPRNSFVKTNTTTQQSASNIQPQTKTNEKLETRNDITNVINKQEITTQQSASNIQPQTKTNEKLETRNDITNVINKQEITTQQSASNIQPQTKTNEKLETRNDITNKLQTKNKPWEYGLQWNIPFTKNVNFLNINRANNPAVVFIPSLFFRKELGKKSSLELYFNPYSTYYINNKTVMQQNSYNVTITQGSRVVTNNYTEINAVNKLTSLELGLFYGHNINKQLMVRAGVSNNWSNWAMLNTTVLRNGSEVSLDTLYSISKGNSMWNNISPTFLLGKLDVLYSFNKLEVGINFTTPLKPLTNLPNDNTPINTNLFMRWRLK